MSNLDSIKIDKIGFLDIGNSSIKLGLRKEEHWEIKIFTNADELTLTLLDDGMEYLIICNVRSSVNWLEKLSEHFSIAILETEDIPQQQLRYNTPKTLGMDRYLACLGAWSMFQSPVVVIDSGSACTIDFMDQSAVYHGGVIMPGIQTLLGVFYKSAPALPQFQFAIPSHFPGVSSKDSLQWGLSQLFLDGVNSNLNRYDELHHNYQLVVTGGDAETLSPLINRDLIVSRDLIFIGMETFLQI